MSYIGTQPVPQSLQSRQQFTGDGSTTTFATIGGVELYEDVFLNGVRLSRVDNEYSFDGTTLTITPAPANGDTVSIILRNDHSDLVALPITDSQGNNVLSESGGVVTLTADEANVGSNALVVDSSGNVGIGTSSPLGLTDIRGTSGGLNVGIRYGTLNVGSRGTTGGSLFVSTDSLNENYSSGLLVDGSYSGGKSLVNIKATGANSGGPYSADLVFHTQVTTTISERMRIASSGNVIINDLGTGTVYSNNGILTNTNPSDLNLKENVVEVSYGLSEVKQLRPVEFDWIADEADKHELGFIAQEVQLIIPDLVNTYERIINEETGETEIGYGLESTQFIPVLVKAIQEQQALIESQQSQIDALTARIEALEATP